MDKHELIELIHEAFNGVTRTGGVSLHETVVIDHYGSDEERAEARKKDRDGRWQNVPYEDLAEVCGIGGISFFDPIGWRYYLPAYMRWYLSDEKACESFASSSLLYSLTPEKGELDEYNKERYESLNEKQSEAVKAFLEFIVQSTVDDEFKWCSEWNDATQALDRYWNRF